ncbi:MAG: D-alanyl-D-alanine carboxypeptidase [Proteobacteria bacterium]|nr:D-alanyl-D-alanine carboxypeptidase [Pseudomonadota bacterium]
MRLFAFLRMSLFSLSLLAPLGLAANAIPAVPTAPEVSADAYVLIDFHSGKILAEKESHKRIDPASLTKMMTVYVFDHELHNGHFTLEDEIAVSENAWKTEGSRMFVPVGKKIPAKDLLRGIIIQSGNDATVALAEYVAGSEKAFADLMNQYAQRLGMKDTHFVNSTGIPNPEHYTTAYDLSLLASAIISQFPETYKIYSEKWFTFNGIKQPNRNRLLWREPYIDGIKTGHSSTAGYCLAASGQKDNMRLISILVGAQNESDRTEQTLQLLRFGFRFFETHHLYKANTTLNEPRVWMGDRKTLSLGINQDLFITIPQGQYKSLDAKMNIDKSLTAPINKGENHGKLVVKLGDELIAEMPLVALEDVNKGTMWDRFSDYVSLGFHKMLNSASSSETPATQGT